MQIDVILDSRASGAELAEMGQLAESCGMRGVWVSSLLDSRDPFTNLAPLAQATSRLLLGPIAVNPYDTHPVKIAAAFLTLNELAAGRARIVIGGGGEALEALDIKPLRRVRAVRECVEIMRAAATAQPLTYNGEMYRVRDLRLAWPSAPAPPIFVGAGQPQMLRMAARVADGIMMSDLPVKNAAAAIATLDDALRASDKRRPAFQTSVFTAWHVYEDRQKAIREARQWLLLRGIFRPWLLQEFLAPEDVDLVMANRAAFAAAFAARDHHVAGVPDRILDTLVDRLTLTGDLRTLDQKLEKLGHFSEAGLGSIALRLYDDPAQSIRLLGERVVPAVS